MTDANSPTEIALRNGIRANRADTLARRVYADWLDEQSDPVRTDLATYIRLESEWLSRPPGDGRFAELVPEVVAHCERTGRSFGGWEFAEELFTVEAKLRAVRLGDPSFALFGAGGNYGGGHRYKLDPPIPEPDLLRFEAKFGFPLPTEYRAFLLHLGNGPAGPYHGLSPLDLTQDPDSLRRTFPFTRADAKRGEAALREDRHDEALQFPDDDTAFDGHLHLSEVGCGAYEFLVLNGDARGTVWGSGGMCELVVCRTDAGTPHTFLTWYESWLDHGLRPDVLAYYRSRQQEHQ